MLYPHDLYNSAASFYIFSIHVLNHKYKDISFVSSTTMKILFLFSVYSFQDDLSGQALLDVVFAKLNLIETAYFGLRYLDAENQTVC